MKPLFLMSPMLMRRSEIPQIKEVAGPSGYSAGFVIQMPQVQVLPWLLAGFVLARPEFKFSATFI